MDNWIKFEYSDIYSITFGNFTESKCGQKTYAYDLVERWKSFTEELQYPYDENLAEFQNDLHYARWLIEICLHEKTLNEFEEHKSFTQKIARIDTIFISVTQEHPGWSELNRFWWKKRLPKKITREFFDGDSDSYLIKEGSVFEIFD